MVWMTINWFEGVLKDVCENKTKTCKDYEAENIDKFVGLEHLKPEDLKISSWGLIEEGTTFTKIFYPGQVLFGKRRSYQKKAAIAEFKGVCSGDILVLEAKKDIIIPGLLPYIIQNDGFFDFAVGTSSGSLSPRTSWKHISQYKIKIPKDQHIQKEILAKIKKVEEAISLKEQLKCTTETYKNVLMRQIFLKGLYTAKLKESLLGEIPIHWEVKKLKQLGTFKKGKGIAKKDLSGDGYSCVLYGELYTRYDSVIEKVFSKTQVPLSKTITANKGDVLLPSSGETAFDIACASALLVDNVLIGGDINIFRPSAEIDSLFLSYAINSVLKNRLSGLAQGSSVYHLYGETLGNFNVMVPPIEEQRKIVTLIYSLDRQIQRYKEEKQTLISIKTVVQNKLLSPTVEVAT